MGFEGTLGVVEREVGICDKVFSFLVLLRTFTFVTDAIVIKRWSAKRSPDKAQRKSRVPHGMTLRLSIGLAPSRHLAAPLGNQRD